MPEDTQKLWSGLRALRVWFDFVIAHEEFLQH